MQILCNIVLDIHNTSRVHEIFKKFEATTGYSANAVSYTRAFWKARGLASVGHVVEWLVSRVDSEIYAAIETTRATMGSKPENVLQGLVSAQNKYGYDNAFIRDNIVALLAAGYDTTGAALSWTIFWLGKQNDILGPVDAYRSEVLRYCPPIEILPRRIAPGRMEDACIAAPSIRAAIHTSSSKGPMVSPCVHRIHHDPAIYSDPGEFNPNRFIASRRRSPNEYMPFGAGRRICLGINLGKIIVDRVIENLRCRNLKVVTNTQKFAPIRRNVSIWPAWKLRGHLVFDTKRGL